MDTLIAGADRTYDQLVAAFDAQYGSSSSHGDTGIEGARRQAAISTRDAQYYAARDTSWAGTLSGSTTIGNTPWTLKATTAANAQSAYSTNRARAQAAHDAALLSAMNDWRDVWSAKTIARINSQEVSSESYRHAVSAALAQWDQSTGDLSDRLPDHVGYMVPPSVIAVADEPIIHSPNLPIPGGSEVATQGATDREGMPGRPVPHKRSWLTGEGTWLRSNDEPAPTDRTWWQFGGEMVRSAVELTPAMQFNEMVQQCNEYFDRPVYFNEMADALDGSTQNIMNVFSFGATDYVGATQTDTFQGWQWDWQRGLFTFSREMLISAATGGSGTMMRTSTGTASYAWGGVWIAGLGYDSYNMGQHSSQAYEDFRQGDIRGGLWHTGLAVVSAFGIRAGLKGSALGKAGSTVDESSALAKVADEAPSSGLIVRQGNIVVEAGAKVSASEAHVGRIFANHGYDVTHKVTASAQGIQGTRTADLVVNGVGRVDVFTPKAVNSTSIARAIESKGTQAPVVAVSGNVSNQIMQETARRMWGKTTASAKAIQQIVFENNGGLTWFTRPQ
jgi:hypothetical protein